MKKLSRHNLRRLIEALITEETRTSSVTISNAPLKAYMEFGVFMGKKNSFTNSKDKTSRDKAQKEFGQSRDKLFELKPNVKSLSEFDKKLAGAYLFSGAVDDEAIKNKFGITGTDAKKKIDDIFKKCKKEAT